MENGVPQESETGKTEVSMSLYELTCSLELVLLCFLGQLCL